MHQQQQQNGKWRSSSTHLISPASCWLLFVYYALILEFFSPYSIITISTIKGAWISLSHAQVRLLRHIGDCLPVCWLPHLAYSHFIKKHICILCAVPASFPEAHGICSFFILYMASIVPVQCLPY